MFSPQLSCWLAGWACLVLAAATSAVAAESPDTLRLPHCVVSLIDEAQVPAREPGVLVALEVREGLAVEKDTLLGRVDDQQAAIAARVAQTQYDVARKEAENDISVRAAQAAAQVAESEYQEALEANQQVRGTVTPAEVRRLLLTHRRSLLQIELAQLEYDVTRQSVAIRAAELEAAQQALARRRIEAPLAGVVAQVHRRQGEWLDPGAPVVRIVRMDALRVEGFMSTAQWAPYELIDRPVSVAVQLTRGRVEQFASRVAFVSPLVEASGEFRVWCEIENRRENGQWLVNPGMRAEMAIAPNR